MAITNKGDTAYLVRLKTVGNRDNGDAWRIYPVTVKTVGRKYITVMDAPTYGREAKFNIDDDLRQVVDFGSVEYKLFIGGEEAYDKAQEFSQKNKRWELIHNKIRNQHKPPENVSAETLHYVIRLLGLDAEEHRATIKLDAAETAFINKYADKEPASAEEALKDTFSVTANFDDGYEMDIKLCPVTFEEGTYNAPFTEAVLFQHGCEVACTEPEYDFFGEWILEDTEGDVTHRFIVTVEATEKEDK